MKLSAKARYSVHIVTSLARRGDKLLSVSQLASETGVTEKYLEQILALLKKGNIVTSTRGSAGGYQLASDAGLLTVGQVLRCVEDNLEIVSCIHGECQSQCTCVSHNLWVNLHNQINNYLDTISIKQLLEDNNESIS